MNVFLKNKDYRRFSIASFLSGTGDILFYMALMTYASKLKNYSLALSLIAISESLPKLLEIFAGYLADRTHHKFKNIFLMAIIRFVLYGLVGILFASNISDWNLVLIVIVINLISDSFGSYSGGLVTPLIVDLVGKEEYGEAAGFTSGISQVISVTAQFAGAALLLIMSYSSLAFFNAFTFLAAGILYASVGLKHNKNNSLEPQEVNDKKFLATMKSSYNQLKNQHGLLTIVIVVAILNGVLDAMQSLIPIVMVGNKSTMIISSYSFTIAIMGVVVSCGAALGSIFGPQLFKKVSVFSMTIIAIILSLMTTLGAIFANIYTILPCYFLLGATASLASIKMSQWLITVVDKKILASSAGLLNTIVMVVAPLMTSAFTTISGVVDIKLALVALIAVEILVLLVAVKMVVKSKKNNVKERENHISVQQELQ